MYTHICVCEQERDEIVPRRRASESSHKLFNTAIQSMAYVFDALNAEVKLK